MKITTTKTKSTTSKPTRSRSEQRFDKAWQQVLKQQKDNEQLQEHIQEFVKSTTSRLQEKEKACMDTMYDCCLHLLSFLNRKSLTVWQREALIDWVTRHLVAMRCNPFGTHLDFSPIMDRLDEAYAALNPAPDYGDYNDIDDEDFLFDEFFSDDESNEGPFGFEQNRAFFEEFINDLYEQEQAAAQQHYEEKQALKQLMKSSSVNRLFRKVAAILHPDKEPEETLRNEKNHLMSELVKARDTNDIPCIFDFYAKYVGESPLKELGKDLDSASELLEDHYLDLLDAKNRIIHGDPIAGALYHHFHKKTPAATTRAINKHLKEIEEQHAALKILRKEVTSLKTLKPFLELHHDMIIREEEPGF